MPFPSIDKPELLAPAGSREVLEVVVEAGADAVYLSGKRFAMRQHAPWLNFDDEGLLGAAEYLHSRGRKLYVTLNNIYTGSELALLPEYLEFLGSVRPDALIVADYGLIRLLRSLGNRIPLFASVMMQIHSAEGAREMRDLGLSRIVASQHLGLEAVRRIQEATGIEVEYFIHGDTCSSVHSLCTHSGISAGELAGRGKCLKSCRWPWDFVSLGEGREAACLKEDRYLLARKDLCLYKQLPRLIHAGFTSFKIEGRARSAAFLRPIVEAYRGLIDDYCADPAAYVYDAPTYRQLQETRQRDFSTSWSFGNPARDAVGYDGAREPRFFSIAIEEKDAALTGQEEWAALTGVIPAALPGDGGGTPALTVRCGSPEAVRVALDHGADRVLIGGEIAIRKGGQRWTLDALREAAGLAHEHGRQALLTTPRMTTEQTIDEYRVLFGRLDARDFDAVHVHNPGMLRLARESLDTAVHADFTFNLINAGACDMLAGLGVRQATLSLEATLAQAIEIRKATVLPLELIVHGSLPRMVLEQCVIAALTMNTTPDDPCPAPCQSGRYGLRDRLGQIHPIEPDQYCRNHLLMGKDLCTLGHLEHFLRGRFASLRLELQYAGAAQVAMTTALYRKAIDRFAAGRETLVEAGELAMLRRDWPRPFSLGAYANRLQAVAVPDGELPTNLMIRHDPAWVD